MKRKIRLNKFRADFNFNRLLYKQLHKNSDRSFCVSYFSIFLLVF